MLCEFLAGNCWAKMLQHSGRHSGNGWQLIDVSALAGKSRQKVIRVSWLSRCHCGPLCTSSSDTSALLLPQRGNVLGRKRAAAKQKEKEEKYRRKEIYRRQRKTKSNIEKENEKHEEEKKRKSREKVVEGESMEKDKEESKRFSLILPLSISLNLLLFLILIKTYILLKIWFLYLSS